MVKYCAVALCTNGTHNRPDLSYFAFRAKHPTQLKAWKHFCRRSDLKFKTLVDPRICSLHFNPSDIKTSLTGRRIMAEGCSPSIFNVKEGGIGEKSEQSRRNQTRNKRKSTSAISRDCAKKMISSKVEEIEEVIDSSHLIEHQTSVNLDFVSTDHCYAIPEVRKECENDIVKYPTNTQNTACQTDLTLDMINRLETELKNSTSRCESLTEKLNDKKALKRELNFEDILRDDESVRFYTGLPHLRTFVLILELISPYAEKIKYWDKKKQSQAYYQKDPQKNKPGRKRQLNVKEEFVLVLCKLRLGLLNRHIGQMFAVCESTVSKIFITWVCLLQKIFKDTLLRWPSKAEIQKSLPKTFKTYPNTRIIVDATEFFIEKPTSPSAQKSTWSEYKHHNTMKLLVGIAPCGSFTFISKLWSGSTSDRKITMESGLIELLEEGDSVMADRGFNIRDLLTGKGVKLNIPPHSQGKQLSRKSRSNTSNIAKVRIHVERAIERLKNFKILAGNIPLSTVGIADHVVIVCAALCNLLPALAK